MRQLAQRIERLLRNNFLSHAEAMSDDGQESYDDRQEIMQRTQAFIAEGYDAATARQKAVEDWLTNFLIDNCMKIG